MPATAQELPQAAPSVPAPPPAASAPRGAPDDGARLFKLRAGKLPTAHLPYDFRFSRAQFETLELYDQWVRGTVLQVDDFDFDLHLDDGEYRCPAGRVTWLLRLVSSDVWLSDSEQLDARRPAAEQLATFEQLGFTSVPSPGRLLLRFKKNDNFT